MKSNGRTLHNAKIKLKHKQETQQQTCFSRGLLQQTTFALILIELFRTLLMDDFRACFVFDKQISQNFD
jgi:hypothetical protein